MKKSKGLVGLESFKGRLRIRLPRQCFNGDQKYLSLGLLDTTENRAIAELKMRAIQADIDLDRFDHSLNSYRPNQAIKIHREIKITNITLLDLWLKYLDYLSPIRKRSTMVYFDSLTTLIKRSRIINPGSALDLRQWLIKNTSESYVKRVLTQVAAAYKWGVKNKLLPLPNPYIDLAQEFNHPYERNQYPLAFSSQEKELILSAFKNHCGSNNGRGVCGYGFNYYYPLVKFLFLTGCRPSEAIGLYWSDISQNLNSITFNGGIQTLNTGEIYNSKGLGSKTNKNRIFPCNQELKELLQQIYTPDQQLVFPARNDKSKPIRYGNFRNAWKKIVYPIINKSSTPYNCRDTFICDQIREGIPIAIIAKWVDNSVASIEKYYLDQVSNRDVLPR